jgi:hypothetical protein
MSWLELQSVTTSSSYTCHALCLLYAELDVLDARWDAVHDLLLSSGARGGLHGSRSRGVGVLDYR